MFAFPLNVGNPNVITVTAGANGEGVFDSTMPARLTGVITPGEYAGSIQRCNAAYAPGAARTLARMCIFGGILFWIIFIAVFVFTSTNGGSYQPGYMFGGFGVMLLLVIGGSIWLRHDIRTRHNALALVVAQEHAAYNSEARAQQYGPLPIPMSWTMVTTVIDNSYGYYRRRRMASIVHIQIELGHAAPAFMQPGVAMFAAPPGYAQYGAAAQAPPVYAQAQQQQPGMHPYNQAYQNGSAEGASTLANPAYASPNAAAAQGGAGYGTHAQAQPQQQQQQAGVCNRCGRPAANATDRFCAFDGGSFQR